MKPVLPAEVLPPKLKPPVVDDLEVEPKEEGVVVFPEREKAGGLGGPPDGVVPKLKPPVDGAVAVDLKAIYMVGVCLDAKTQAVLSQWCLDAVEMAKEGMT